jgi:hypothetical protein
MERHEVAAFIEGIDGLSGQILKLVKICISSEGETYDLHVPIFALSKVAAIHMKAMAIGLKLDEAGKEELVRFFIGSLTASLEDLDVLHNFIESEEIINKMMGKE